MKFILVALACVYAVNAQGTSGPDPSGAPPGTSPQSLPVDVADPELEPARPSAMPSAASPSMKPSPVVTIPSQPAISPPRPKGCSPGCGPNEICAELGLSYCRPGQSCSVCIKMTSIRFPASAIYSMIQPPKAPEVPTVPQVSFPSSIIPTQSTSQNSNLLNSKTNTQPAYEVTPLDPAPQDPFGSFTVTTQTQQSQPEPTNSLSLFGLQPPQHSRPGLTSIYDPLPQQNNNLDMFGFPMTNQQTTNTNTFGNMFPLLWMGDFGMGF